LFFGVALGPINDMFAWNHHLRQAAFPGTEPTPWILPVIHGFADQSSTPADATGSSAQSHGDEGRR